MKYTPTMCDHCGQTQDYLINLDKGSALIVMALAYAVKRLDRNKIHLAKEMEIATPDIVRDFGDLWSAIRAGYMSARMTDNILRPKYFGLVAQCDGGGKGEYLLTPRGARFLKGDPIEAAAVIDKRTHSKRMYWEPSGSTTIHELLAGGQMWDLATLTSSPHVTSLIGHSGDNQTLF